jgi:quercetin dioxygenase-like cupin family protein
MRAFWMFLALMPFAAAPALAQDPVEVDPGHYKVEFENEQVRVLRITYGPNEKSVMHDHPAGVGVFLTDSKARFTVPDGEPVELDGKAGDAIWSEAGPHLPENMTDQPFELILVELKDPSHGHE